VPDLRNPWQEFHQNCLSFIASGFRIWVESPALRRDPDVTFEKKSMKRYFLHPESIRSLFDNIAPTYDLLNRLLSLGRDIYWRKMAVRELKGLEGRILDIATGTGDVAIEIVRQRDDRRKVFGVDFSGPMIKKARQKVFQKGLSQTIALSLGDALSLPFRENTFSATMIAFGLRNIVEKEGALSEMVRVIKRGGRVIILEFTFPRKGLMKRIYPIYFQKVLPRVGGLISGDRSAYAYLPESVFHFASVENYEGIMRKVGLEEVSSRALTGGVASIISGTKTRS
jgi:demethylmenaquinone methyltransferase/2-methoxy-6-polyprenyl-1,4-benzoquinol methylase